jgi:uncharacterized protein
MIVVRLTEAEKEAIVTAVRRFDPEAHVFLFGSRVDDTKKGGDIDLLILSGKLGRAERMGIRRMISDSIGDQKIDILIASDLTDPMALLARNSGAPLS